MWAGLLSWRPLGGLVLAPAPGGGWWSLAICGWQVCPLARVPISPQVCLLSFRGVLVVLDGAPQSPPLGLLACRHSFHTRAHSRVARTGT